MTSRDSFDSSRVWAERVRRMSAAWGALEPEASELAAARARFAARRSRRARSRLLPTVIAFAVLFVGAGALGQARLASIRASHAARGVSETVADGVAIAPASAPEHRAQAAPSSEPALPDPAPASEEITTAPAPQAPTPPVAPSPRVAGPSLEGPPRSAGVWSAAAAALRAGDYGEAERAFGEIARSSDLRTRDEARLARAQVLITEGRGGDARTELQDLARSGATPLVRARAADALRMIEQGQPSTRGSGN